MPDDQQLVRPIGTEQHPAPGPPRLTIALGLLALGALIGWGIASLGGDTIATAPTTTTLATDASPLGDATLEPDVIPTVTWRGAASVPSFPDGTDYAGATDPVELDGTIYLAVNFADRDSGSIRNELWSSADGVEWTSTTIDLNEPVTVTELTAVRDGLLLTGTGERSLGLWRSIPGRAIGEDSWNKIPLDIPPDLVAGVHSTAVNDDGEIITTVIGNIDIWRETIAPYVPSGVDLADPVSRLTGSTVYLRDGSQIEVFAEPPEVLTADDTIWIRLKTLDGEEVLQIRELPPGVYPVEATPDLSFVPVALSWRSEDGTDFLPTTGRNALPPGYFLARAWGAGFVAAAYEPSAASLPAEDVALWQTGSGVAWRPVDTRPPQECSPFLFTSTRDHILLTGQDGTRCVGTADMSWTVLPDPCTSCYAIGGPAGFLAYPDEFEYDTAVYSRDGTTWIDTTIPAPEPYPSLSILEDRLFALSVIQPRATVPKHIDIWIGEIS